MAKLFKWLNLQLFAGEGAGGDGGGEGTATQGETSPDPKEARLLELGVPADKIRKRANRASSAPVAQQEPQPTQQAASAEDKTPEESTEEKPSRMSWDEIMKDPEYNAEMQKTVQARLRSAKTAEDSMSKLAPALELLTRRYGLDSKNLDAEALAKAISDDDSYYEDKALEMGVPVETAKKIDQNERDAARRQAEEAREKRNRELSDHFYSMQKQSEELKKMFPSFDLEKELKDPDFLRMTQPGGVSVKKAYFANHADEIQAAAMQVTAQKTAQQMANSIRSGQSRPVENGTSSQAPSNTSFNYAQASKDQREAFKRSMKDAWARGEKFYPGQR